MLNLFHNDIHKSQTHFHSNTRNTKKIVHDYLQIFTFFQQLEFGTFTLLSPRYAGIESRILDEMLQEILFRELMIIIVIQILHNILFYFNVIF